MMKNMCGTKMKELLEISYTKFYLSEPLWSQSAICCLPVLTWAYGNFHFARSSIKYKLN